MKCNTCSDALTDRENESKFVDGGKGVVLFVVFEEDIKVVFYICSDALSDRENESKFQVCIEITRFLFCAL